MKIPKKRQLQQFAINHSSDFNFDTFERLYNKCTAKTYSFKAIATALLSDIALYLCNNLFEEVQKAVMTNDQKKQR